MEDDDLEREWARVVASWDDDKAHDRFLVLCDSSDRLAVAGRRYREVRETDPARAAEASRRIDDILSRAMAHISVMRTERAPRRSPIEWVALGVSSALLAALLWQILRAI
jgi:hypothetical protein